MIIGFSFFLLVYLGTSILLLQNIVDTMPFILWNSTSLMVLTVTAIKLFTAENGHSTVKSLKAQTLLLSPIGSLVLIFFAAQGLKRYTPLVVRVAVLAALECPTFIWRFGKTLFLLVHSKELALCSVVAGLTVLLAYPIAQHFSLQLLPSLVFAGLLGATLGVLDYEYVSKRVLRVA